MDQIKLAEFAKNSENKEGADFTQAAQEAGIAQGSLIVSRLFNTMLGEVTRVMRSWNDELVNVLQAGGINPSALTNEQLLAALLQLIRNNSGGTQLGDLVPNIGTVSPVGRVLCKGGRLANCKTIFPDFYNYVINSTPYKTVAEFNAQVSTYGQCGFCAVDGDDVIVPLITRPISGVSNLNQTGQAIMDTMRPIKGPFGAINMWIMDYFRGGGPASPFTWKNIGHRQGPKSGSSDEYAYIELDTSTLGSRYNGNETRGKQVQYPYYIQVYTAPASAAMADTAALVEMLKYQNQLGIQTLPSQGGNINLVSGGIYSGVVSQNTNFILPQVSDVSLLNQIIIQLQIVGQPAIDWGTTKYFNSEPTVSEGFCNIVYEYDALVGAWIVGQIEKVVA